MASSSLVVTQPQVFISFRGRDLRNDFVDSLAHEMKNEKLNVFIDEDMVRGKDLHELLVEIEASTVAIVIFSKNYTDSFWCLKELARIKDCVDRGTLMAIPIFYKIETSVVQDLTGDFGDAFRSLKEKHRHDPETEKWVEAIASITRKSGMELQEHSNVKDRIFRKNMIVEVKKSLEYIRNKADQRRRSETIPYIQSEAIQSRQSETIQNIQSEAVQIPEPVVTPQGCTFSAKQLKISKWENAKYWTIVSISESPNEEAIEVGKMRVCYYLDVRGSFGTGNLTPGTMYEVVFVVKIEDTMSIWDRPAIVELMVPEKALQERELQFVDLEKNKWVEIQAGVFDARPHKAVTAFTLYQFDNNKKTGLVVKGAIVRPMV
ncbi:hypothetical protein AALP_AA6G195800 [Arabis alpina]|uniref:TIR domain-containing protein n=1 Tax=Arabis alpina TaxID=50452 RepID=A0A087GQC0_ARAAL|nr:hypothetical protein AALP_AA6G195800 [Arabis alpina]